jgi:hypothetical protein
MGNSALHYATEDNLERLIGALEKKRAENDWSTTLREDSADESPQQSISPTVH